MRDSICAECWQDENHGRGSYVAHPHHDDVVELPVDVLQSADSPRLSGEVTVHAQTLAETDAVLPPILVHRGTMRVIDGMHRLLAARLKGAKTIRASFFDGDESEAFVVAVKSNIAHGLALSLADRKAASLRIMRSHPHWSDRMIAEATGLSHKTIGAQRRRSTGEIPQSTVRLGRDGRIRPINSSDGRQRASEFLKENPELSLNEVALAAGISPTTVKDVRERLRRGNDPVPQRRAASSGSGSDKAPADSNAPASTYAASTIDGISWTTSIRRLSADPSLRLTDSGRTLLRWLNASPRTVEETARLADQIPEHHIRLVATLARQNADRWQQLAARLNRHPST